MPELPGPDSGLTVNDIRRAVLQAKRDQAKRPALRMLTDDVPAEYIPTGEEIPEVPNDVATDPDAGDAQR